MGLIFYGNPSAVYILHTCFAHHQNALAEDYERVNVIGTENVLRQADKQKMCQGVQQDVHFECKVWKFNGKEMESTMDAGLLE